MSKIKLWLAAVIGFFVLTYQVSKAKTEQRHAEQELDRAEAEALKEVAAMRERLRQEARKQEVANNAQKDVVKLDAGAAADKLRNDWARD